MAIKNLRVITWGESECIYNKRMNCNSESPKCRKDCPVHKFKCPQCGKQISLVEYETDASLCKECAALTINAE